MITTIWNACSATRIVGRQVNLCSSSMLKELIILRICVWKLDNRVKIQEASRIHASECLMKRWPSMQVCITTRTRSCKSLQSQPVDWPVKSKRSSCVVHSSSLACHKEPNTIVVCTIWTTRHCPMAHPHTWTLNDHWSIMENQPDSTSRTSARVSTYSQLLNCPIRLKM